MPATRQVSRLPADAAATLDTLWSRLAVDGEPACDDQELTRVAQAVSGAARREGMMPEQVLIALKESWVASGALRLRPDRAALEPILSALVTRCIRAYFDGGAVVGGAIRTSDAVNEPLV